jgi:hypothetical protein
MMKKVHIPLADLREVVDALYFHRLGFHEAPVFPVASLGGNLPDVDSGLKLVANG